MANEDGTVWTIFNGEIYNHKELRHRLETRGHIFKGHADTEVLPHLYEEEGSEFVSSLRGMFALAIYDVDKHLLILARDRFGIKPLFFAPGKYSLAFASEIRALLELPEIDDRPDRQAIYDFAALFYIPAPETFYRGIRAVQPGEVLEVHLDGNNVVWKAHPFYRWSIAPDPTLTLDQAADRADALITAAVRRQLESDVPLGALLSGGIDSSLISVSAQSALSGLVGATEANENGGELRTFNVRFSEQEYDETWAAVTVAKEIGSHHETLDMDRVAGNWDDLTDLLLHAGQPFADTSLFAVNAICRLMRRRVTVALSGDGGDEAFGGYDIYWRIARIAALQKLPFFIARGLYGIGAVMGLSGLVQKRLPERLQEITLADDTALVQSLFCWINEEEHRRLCSDTDLLPVRRLFEPQWNYHLPRRASHLQRLSARATEVNSRLTLPNDFLFKVDTGSMKESVEIRVPMLDEDLFNFGLSLPHKLKAKGKTCKRVLRAVAKRKLPSLIASKPKRGFAIPIDSWIDAKCKAELKDVLLGPSSSLPEVFSPKVYRPLVESFYKGYTSPSMSRGKLYQMAIMLLSLHLALSRRNSRSIRSNSQAGGNMGFESSLS